MKTVCECGRTVLLVSLKAHLTTQIHKDTYNAYQIDYTISIKNSELIPEPSRDEQVDLITRALTEMIEVAKKHTNFRRSNRIKILLHKILCLIHLYQQVIKRVFQLKNWYKY